MTRRSPVTIESIAPSTPDVDRLTRDVVAHLTRPGAPGRALPGDRLGGDLTVVVRGCLSWLLRRAAGAATTEQIPRLDSAAAGWARAGVPIDTVLHAVHDGVKVSLDLLFPRSGPARGADIVPAAAAALELLNLVSATVGKAYVREQKAAAAPRHTAVHTLTSALLSGHATSAIARDHGIPLAERYFVLALAVPAHPDEHHPRLDGQVVARRKLRRLQAALATELGNQALSLLSVDGGTILVPTTACAETALDGLVERFSRAARVHITAAVLTATVAQIPTAATQAHELLDTAEHLGLGPGLHRLADLALQYQLVRPGAGRDSLEACIALLDDHPDLLRTLQTFIDTDLSRLRTAEALYVHPNTVDYRLRRVAEVTGHDPARPDGLFYLRSALIARASAGATAPAHPPRPVRPRRAVQPLATAG
ncbi:helix-turn-helix domain-containing protein [Nocardia farcinica]|nr:helix-turn-helix domain-containing protein [Nocardia farcinica]